MLMTLMEKVDNMQQQMSKPSGEMVTVRKNQKEVLEIKNNNTVTEMKNVFDWLISRQDMTEGKDL